MKTKFNDFINESKNDKSYEDYINDIKKALMHDFNYNSMQADGYITQYEELFNRFYEQDFDIKEAIAATKIPGVKISNSNTNESFNNSIDNDIDNLTSMIENIKTKRDLAISHKAIREYFKKYSSKTYSDVRIFERVKNNYKKVKMLFKNKLNSLK
jgi:hypothetical protein